MWNPSLRSLRPLRETHSVSFPEHFHTSNSEEPKFLSGRRSEYVLATKCGCTVVHKDEHTDETPHVWSAENLFRGLHESLGG
jgi:hypothetical protein